MSTADELALAAWCAAARAHPQSFALRAAVNEQRWLVAVMLEERRRTPHDERDAFDARCERLLHRLDPPVADATVMAVPELLRPHVGVGLGLHADDDLARRPAA